MAYTTQYIGSRYVPLFAEPAEWNSARTYEPLTIVMHDGNSYTSRQYVPAGIEITNEKFWALTGNYNAQVDAYRHEVQVNTATTEEYKTKVDGAIDTMTDKITQYKSDIDASEQNFYNQLNTEFGSVIPLDSAPIENSIKGVTSGGVYNIINNTKNTLQASIDDTNFANDIFIVANRNYHNEGAVDFWFTDNFIDYYPLSINNKIFSSCDLLYLDKINNFYYIWTNSQYAVSIDFKNWTVYNHNIANGNAVYGACFVPKTEYIIGSRKYIDTKTAVTAFGTNTYFFIPFIVKYTQNEKTGELSFDNAVDIVPPNFTLNASSFIDPYVVEMDNIYYIVFKDEIATKAVLYTARDISDISTWSSVDFNTPFYGYEAPKLFIDGNKNINMLVSYYNLYGFVLAQCTTEDSKTKATVTYENEPWVFYNVFNHKENDLNYIQTPNYNGYMHNRHSAIIKIDSIISRAFNFVKKSYMPKVDIFIINDSTYNGPQIPATRYIQVNKCNGVLNFYKNNVFMDNNFVKSIIMSWTGSPSATLTLKGDAFFTDWQNKQILSQGSTYTPYTIKPGQYFVIDRVQIPQILLH